MGNAHLYVGYVLRLASDEAAIRTATLCGVHARIATNNGKGLHMVVFLHVFHHLSTSITCQTHAPPKASKVTLSLYGLMAERQSRIEH